MTIKKIKNYIEIKKFYKLINKPDNIILFVHYHNVNQFELNTFFYSFIKEEKIKLFFIKLSVIKKIVNNVVLSSLLQGPTYIILIPTLKLLNFFFNHMYLKRNIIPLAFLINKKIYNYNYILNLILKNKKKLKKLKKKKIIITICSIYLNLFLLFIKNLYFTYIKTKTYYLQKK